MQSQCGPHGTQLDAALGEFAKRNAAFSQYAWEVAKQDGCLPCASSSYPTWPPRSEKAWTFPVLQKEQHVLGLDTAQYGAPYVSTQEAEQGASADGLACALPPSLRASLAQQPLSVPDVELSDEPAPTAGLTDAEIAPANTAAPDEEPLEAVPALMMNTAKGVAYDLMHWTELPADGVAQKLSYITSRDDRLRYLAYWLMLIVVVYLFVRFTM